MPTDPSHPRLRGLGAATHFGRRQLGWKEEALVPLLREMGVDVIRQEIDWSGVERSRGAYAIPAEHLRWLDLVQGAGIGVILVLCYGNPVYENPLDPQAYARYAAFMAEACRGRNVVAYELWNEPTNFQFLRQYGGAWSGKSPCPWLDRYAELVQLAAAAIKQVQPGATVLINPGEAQFAHMAEDHAASLAQVDGVCHHPYPMRFPPETAAWGGPQIRARDGIDAADDDHSFASLWRLTRERCRARLGRELQMHATEVGYSTYNPHRTPRIFGGYREDAQAAYLVRLLVLSFASALGSVCVYDFMDDGVNRDEAEDNFGVVRNEQRGFAPKPSFHAIRRLALALGAEWEFLPDAPVVLDVALNPMPRNADDWQAPVIEPHLRLTGAQAYSFRVAGGDTVTVLWRAGRISGEYQDPLGDLVWQAPALIVGASDLVAGTPLALVTTETGGGTRLRDLPVGGMPVAVRWRLA